MLKKSLFSLICFFCLIVTTNAQTEKGYWFFNPQFSAFDLSGTENSLGKDDRLRLGIGVKTGNFIADNLAFIVGAGFQIDKQDKYKSNSFDLSTGLRYYLFSRLFLGAEVAYQKQWIRDYDNEKTRKPDYFLFNADIGYAIFLTHNISLEPGVYWKYSFADKYNQYGVKIGFGLYF